MRRSTTTSIIHGQYSYHVPPCLLSRARSCVHLHPPSSTTPYITDHDEWSTCQSTHGNDNNEYACYQHCSFINKKWNKLFRKNRNKHLTNMFKKKKSIHVLFGLPRHSYKTNTSGQKSRSHEICWEHNPSGNSNRVALHLSATPCNL